MLTRIVTVSLSGSVMILFLLLVRPLLERYYKAGVRYLLWMLLALRLLIPVPLTLPQPPIHLSSLPSSEIVLLSSENPAGELESEGDTHAVATLPQRESTTLSPTDVLTILWSAGAALFLLYHFIAYRLWKRKITPWCTTQIRRHPPVVVCKMISSPMLFGMLKPMVLLPDAGFSPLVLELILEHVLVYYRRKDLWYKLLLLLANAVHWFNPLVYLMVSYANRDLEYACDEKVIAGKDLNYRKRYTLSILQAVQTEKSHIFSTYFRGGKKEMKKRFSNILTNHRKKTGTLMFVMLLAVTTLLGTLVACNPAKNSENPLGYDNTLPLMGADKEKVLETLEVDAAQAEVTQRNQQEEYLLDFTLDDTAGKAVLIFYNDVFMGFQYQLTDWNTAYSYANQIRQELEQQYGEKTTYPGMVSSNKDYFDNITDVSQLKETVEYYEDWTPETDPEQMEKMVGTDYSRIDVRFTLWTLPENTAYITVRYMALP